MPTPTIKLIFVDAGVLIAGARGRDRTADAAMAVLDQPDVRFASSPFIQLEVLPKARYHGRLAEVAFYDIFFASVSVWATATPDLAQHAQQIAVRWGLAALDALHVAAALTVGASELVTTERRSSPLLRVSELPLRTLAEA